MIKRPNDSKTGIDAYCEAHSSLQTELLHQLERETYLKTLAPQMASGSLQGQLLTLLCQLIQPKRVLEIGTFTGYATLCMAYGLPADGHIHTIEINEELAYISNKYFERSGRKSQITALSGDATAVIPSLSGTFDLVFLDAGKKDYAAHFDLVINRVESGGLLLADNVLWSGKVLHPPLDKDTQVLDDFNKKIQNDPRVDNVLLPIRDGLMLIRKK